MMGEDHCPPPTASPPVSVSKFNALDKFSTYEDFRNIIKDKRTVVLLDYDGTLTPIVSDPNLAFLPSDTKELLDCMAGKLTIGVVTGRSIPKIKAFVGLENLLYAGSHGLDIHGPHFKHQVANDYLPIVDEIYEALCAAVSCYPGAWVENNVFALSVHYRNVKDQDQVVQIKNKVAETLSMYPNMRFGNGKKVFEVRPDIEWNKGEAVLWLLRNVIGTQGPPLGDMSATSAGPRHSNEEQNNESLKDRAEKVSAQETEEDTDQDTFTIYIGDDVTDEDAFKVLRTEKCVNMGGGAGGAASATSGCSAGCSAGVNTYSDSATTGTESEGSTCTEVSRVDMNTGEDSSAGGAAALGGATSNVTPRGGLGMGILVTQNPRETAAGYFLHSPTEVSTFLRRLCDFVTTRGELSSKG